MSRPLQFGSFRDIRVHAAAPDFRAGDCALKFSMTYEGTLQTGRGKANPKHERRRQFHTQLKRLWSVNSLLANWHLPISQYQAVPAMEVLAKNYTRYGFAFVPLVSRELSVEAALNFHILRPTTFKGQNADPDNIVKILVDSLKMPQGPDDLPSGAQPQQDETPFCVLMQDDGLLSKITSVSDELLQPILGKNTIERSDTRVLIEVVIRPNYPNNANLIFFSDDFDAWNHQWSEGVFDNIRNWSNSELKARTTQCVLRMRVTASNFKMQHTASWSLPLAQNLSQEQRNEQRQKEMDDFSAQTDGQWTIWNNRLRPIAFALKEELQRRIYGEPPYPSDGYRMLAIDNGMLAGVDPVGEAAIGLESLIRQLP